MNTPLNPVQISPVEDIVADMRAGRMANQAVVFDVKLVSVK